MDGHAKNREVLGILPTKEALDACLAALMEEGFDHSDISLLSSHESLDIAKEDAFSGGEGTAIRALDMPMTYAFPLATAGLIAIVGGPLTAILGGIMAAGMAGMATKDYIEALTSHPKPGEFARALEAGELVVWIYVDNTEEEEKALRILGDSGARNIHAAARKD